MPATKRWTTTKMSGAAVESPVLVSWGQFSKPSVTTRALLPYTSDFMGSYRSNSCFTYTDNVMQCNIGQKFVEVFCIIWKTRMNFLANPM